MIVTTSSAIARHRITKTLGLVSGGTIRARHLGKDLVAVAKNIVGGEIEEYSKMMGEAREQAIDRMCAQAEQLGASAVVDMRLSSSYVMSAASEVLAYGTAVVIKPDKAS